MKLGLNPFDVIGLVTAGREIGCNFSNRLKSLYVEANSGFHNLKRKKMRKALFFLAGLACFVGGAALVNDAIDDIVKKFNTGKDVKE